MEAVETEIMKKPSTYSPARKRALKKYYISNREKINDYSKKRNIQYYNENREQVLLKKMTYYELNRTEILEKKRQYYLQKKMVNIE